MKLEFLLLALIAPPLTYASESNTVQKNISIERLGGHADQSIIKILKLNNGEKIYWPGSLLLTTPKNQYYYIPIENTKTQECKLTFIDATQKEIISDGDLSFYPCKFVKPPEISDINHDGIQDFSVWMNLVHQNTGVRVDTPYEFVFKKDAQMFCSIDTGIPCP